MRRHPAVEAVREACQGRRDSVDMSVFFELLCGVKPMAESTMKEKGTRDGDDPEG